MWHTKAPKQVSRTGSSSRTTAQGMKMSARQDEVAKDMWIDVSFLTRAEDEGKAGERSKPDMWATLQGYKGILDRGTSVGVWACQHCWGRQKTRLSALCKSSALSWGLMLPQLILTYVLERITYGSQWSSAIITRSHLNWDSRVKGCTNPRWIHLVWW
jgi:hypothetical protein